MTNRTFKAFGAQIAFVSALSWAGRGPESSFPRKKDGRADPDSDDAAPDARRRRQPAAQSDPFRIRNFMKSLRPGGVSFLFFIASWRGLIADILPSEDEPAREREEDRRALACFLRRRFNLFLPECLNECSDIRLPASREKRGRLPVRPRTANALLFFTICHTRADDELGRVMVLE